MAVNRLIAGVTTIFLIFFYGCGPKAMAPAKLNTPEHHVSNGNTLMKTGKLPGAYAEFKWAQELDPTFAAAYIGMGLVYGLQGEFDKGLSAMEPANRYAATNAQKLEINVGYMRFYLIGQDRVDPEWLGKVREYYNNAVAIDPESPQPNFYLGLAYKSALEFPAALGEFARVIELDRGYRETAEQEYKNLQRIEQAAPQTEVGRKIAIQETITRADTAALLMSELYFDEQFRRQAGGFSDRGQPRASANDIKNHEFRADIIAAISLNLNGLKLFSGNSFRPDQPMTRAAFAMALEDMLIRVTRDENLATMFQETPSPFPDLRNDRPYFNAVMVVTTRGIMESADARTNDFEPMKPISGVDALVGVYALRKILAHG